MRTFGPRGPVLVQRGIHPLERTAHLLHTHKNTHAIQRSSHQFTTWMIGVNHVGSQSSTQPSEPINEGFAT